MLAELTSHLTDQFGELRAFLLQATPQGALADMQLGGHAAQRRRTHRQQALDMGDHLRRYITSFANTPQCNLGVIFHQRMHFLITLKQWHLQSLKRTRQTVGWRGETHRTIEKPDVLIQLRRRRVAKTDSQPIVAVSSGNPAPEAQPATDDNLVERAQIMLFRQTRCPTHANAPVAALDLCPSTVLNQRFVTRNHAQRVAQG